MNDFKKEYADLKSELDTAVRNVFESGWYILGSHIETFEKEFAKYIGVKYAIGVGNGMQAIQIALLAAGVRPGDEVITTALSAIETSFAISAIGAVPVFVDVDEYYHLDAARVEEKITPKTKALLPVHLYGQPIDVTAFLSIAKKHNLAFIEDACQGHGATYNGKSVGSFGSAGAFSFYPTKNLGGYGDGGAITTNDETIYKQCLLYRNAGRVERYKHIVMGLNSRLDEMQAALLSVKLRHLDEFVAKRRERAGWYVEGLKNIAAIQLSKERADSVHSYHLFVIRTKHRDQLQAHLKERGIESHIHFPTPIPHQPCYPEYRSVQVPTTEQAVTEILSLPIHPFLTHTEVTKVIHQIELFFKTKKYER